VAVALQAADALQRMGRPFPRILAVHFIAVVLSFASTDCGRRGETLTGPTDLPSLASTAFLTTESDIELPLWPPAAPEVFVGAGDIALCTRDGNHEATAQLLDAIGGTVFALGDNAYYSGTAAEYRDCYDRTWGRHKNRTRPVPGNHEYESPGASPYFDYFGINAGPHGLGYYSFDLGAWHVVALNSNIPVSAGSTQGAWLRADLATNRSRCTLAYWHHPRFSSGQHGNQEQMRDFWQILHEAGAEIVLSAHDHVYERFAPQDADGIPDPAHGVRQFVVGTGGARPYAFASLHANSEVRMSTLGVLKLTLTADEYTWEFISVGGPGDSGTASCH
jgi:calcineurin-like phosphoesterase family protein